MKRIIITEEQEKALKRILKEETYQMPVDKKANGPYCVNPDNVKIVKKFLDGRFKKGRYDTIGSDGMPKSEKIVAMISDNGEVLKNMYMNQLLDLLIDRFQNMFSDKIERHLFLSHVMNDWFDDKIGVFGTLTVNRLNEDIKDKIKVESGKVDKNPTDAQKKAGNYKKGHISIRGMKITIETPKGTVRNYHNSDGTTSSIKLKNHYGYFKDTQGNGKDGDAVDVFLGPHIDKFENIFVIDQNNIQGEFDESKVMLGFKTKEEAKQAYLSNYSPKWKGFKSITEVTIPIFKKWLYRGNKQRKPFSEYILIQNNKK